MNILKIFGLKIECKAAKSLTMSFVDRSICCLSYGPVPSTQSIYLRDDATDATEEEEIKFNIFLNKNLILTWIRTEDNKEEKLIH